MDPETRDVLVALISVAGPIVGFVLAFWVTSRHR